MRSFCLYESAETVVFKNTQSTMEITFKSYQRLVVNARGLWGFTDAPPCSLFFQPLFRAASVETLLLSSSSLLIYSCNAWLVLDRMLGGPCPRPVIPIASSLVDRPRCISRITSPPLRSSRPTHLDPKWINLSSTVLLQRIPKGSDRDPGVHRQGIVLTSRFLWWKWLQIGAALDALDSFDSNRTHSNRVRRDRTNLRPCPAGGKLKGRGKETHRSMPAGNMVVQTSTGLSTNQRVKVRLKRSESG